MFLFCSPNTCDCACFYIFGMFLGALLVTTSVSLMLLQPFEFSDFEFINDYAFPLTSNREYSCAG